MRNIYVNYFEFGQVVQGEMPLKYFISSSLVAMLFSGAGPFVQFCRGHYEEHSRYFF